MRDAADDEGLRDGAVPVAVEGVRRARRRRLRPRGGSRGWLLLWGWLRGRLSLREEEMRRTREGCDDVPWQSRRYA